MGRATRLETARLGSAAASPVIPQSFAFGRFVHHLTQGPACSPNRRRLLAGESACLPSRNPQAEASDRLRHLRGNDFERLRPVEPDYNRGNGNDDD